MSRSWSHSYLIATTAGLALLLFLPARAVEPPVVRYDIQVTLDVPGNTLNGRETIRYVSGADSNLSELYLHAYPNAFSGRGSTLAQEMESIYHDYSIAQARAEELGRMDIDSITIDGANASYEIDDTSVKVRLPRPLASHDSLLLEINFVTKIPLMSGRFRAQDGNFSIAQWYPKIAVYDSTGWHHDSYHLTGEFYGEFATYDVAITLPAQYYIGATGEYVAGEGGDNNMPTLSANRVGGEVIQKDSRQIASSNLPSMKTLHFHAEEVHDFAWVASPDYLIDETEWRGIRVKALVLARHAQSQWRNLLSYEIAALKFFTGKVGEYPYPTLTVAEAYNYPTGAMEYPSLVMMDPAAGVPLTHALEYVTVHEVGHNWFYGALANNELDQPWLDEGFEEYFTLCYAEQTYKNGTIFDIPRSASLFLNLPYRWTHEIDYRLLPPTIRSKPVSLPAYQFADEQEYRAIAYSKGALFLERLHNFVGDSTFNQIMRSYYSEYKFKHVTIADFCSVADSVSDLDLSVLSEPSLCSSNSPRSTIQSDTTQDFDAKSIKFVRPLQPFAFADPNHYVVGLNPSLWYNKVDKMRVGVHLQSGYLMTRDLFSAKVIYGTASGKTGYHVSYSTYLRDAPDVRVTLKDSYDEGARNYSVDIGNSRPRNLFLSVRPSVAPEFPSVHNTLSLAYSDQFDPAYFDPKYYTFGKTMILSLHGSYTQRGYEGITSVHYLFAQGLEAHGAGPAFKKGYLSLGQDLRLLRTGELVMTIRGAAGVMSEGAPKQEQFAVGYGVPRSTVDPIGQYVASGGGGVRGYQNDAVLGHRLFAANLELSSERLYLGLPLLDPRLFFDIGRVNNPETSRLANRTLCDAGIEFRALDVLRLSFPLWLSDPSDDHRQFDFRVVARIVPPGH